MSKVYGDIGINTKLGWGYVAYLELAYKKGLNITTDVDKFIEDMKTNARSFGQGLKAETIDLDSPIVTHNALSLIKYMKDNGLNSNESKDAIKQTIGEVGISTYRAFF